MRWFFSSLFLCLLLFLSYEIKSLSVEVDSSLTSVVLVLPESIHPELHLILCLSCQERRDSLLSLDWTHDDPECELAALILTNGGNYHIVSEIFELGRLLEVTLLSMVHLELDHTSISEYHISLLPPLNKPNRLLGQLTLHHYICKWIDLNRASKAWVSDLDERSELAVSHHSELLLFTLNRAENLFNDIIIIEIVKILIRLLSQSHKLIVHLLQLCLLFLFLL